METSTYRTIQPPFTLKFREMSKKELRAYFKWFQEITPERIAEFASAVKSSPPFENWQPDFTPRSLDALGKWFATQIETRPRTREEIAEFDAQAPYPIDRSAVELTNRTFSLAMDIGMYLAQVFLRNHPSVKMDQPFGSKRYIDYGQPVLVGFHGGKVPFNPVGLVVTLAYGLRNNTRTGEGLREIYDIWSKSIG
jgi:hypothetical protein